MSRDAEKFVVDATVAIKWLVPAEHSDLARKLWDREVSAPDLIFPETVNALWKYVDRGELTPDEARRAASLFPADVVTLVPSQPLMQRALDLALALRLPVYDCVYLATAWLLEVPLVTADHRFLKVLGQGTIESAKLPTVLPLSAFAS